MVSPITSSKHHPASRGTLQSRVWTTPQSAVVPSDLGCGFLCINWLLLASLNPFISFVIGQKKKDLIVNLYGSFWLQVFGVIGFCSKRWDRFSAGDYLHVSVECCYSHDQPSDCPSVTCCKVVKNFLRKLFFLINSPASNI